MAVTQQATAQVIAALMHELGWARYDEEWFARNTSNAGQAWIEFDSIVERGEDCNG